MARERAAGPGGRGLESVPATAEAPARVKNRGLVQQRRLETGEVVAAGFGVAFPRAGRLFGQDVPPP